MSQNSNDEKHVRSRRRRRRIVQTLLVIGAIYLLVAYLVAPVVWRYYARRHPSFDDNPRITETSDGHPGDPLNVSLIGTEEHLHVIMKNAKWDIAAALGLESDLAI